MKKASGASTYSNVSQYHLGLVDALNRTSRQQDISMLEKHKLVFASCNIIRNGSEQIQNVTSSYILEHYHHLCTHYSSQF